MTKWKPLALCIALIVGGFALAQDTGYQPPINQGLNLPIPVWDPTRDSVCWTVTGEGIVIRANAKPPAPKSRAEGMTAEQIVAALEAVRVQKAALDQWEMELRSAGLSKRVAKWGVFVEPPPPAQPQIFSFGAYLFGDQ